MAALTTSRTKAFVRAGKKTRRVGVWKILSATLVGWMVGTVLQSPARMTTPPTMTLSPVPLSTIALRNSSESICAPFPNNLNGTIPHCRFFPKQFFEQGAGRPYWPILEHAQRNFTDVLNTRFLVFHLPSASSSTPTTTTTTNLRSTVVQHPHTTTTVVRENGTAAASDCQALYFHIHKNGGTTMERHVPLPMDNYYSKREKSMGRDEFERLSSRVMQRVCESQQHQNQHQYETMPQDKGKQHPQENKRAVVHTFSFLRDPVPRFLSSVAQVLKLRLWHKRLYPCYEHNTTEQLVDCVLTKLEQDQGPSSFLEMHLAPQSFELYKQVMNYDIHITLMDISHLDTVLQQTRAIFKGGQGSPRTSTNTSTSTRSRVVDNHWTEVNIHKERSTAGSLIRRFPHFRLTQNLLTPERIRRICKIYEMDVVMIYETGGVTETVCPMP
jgi:hypothetical protein